MLTHKHFRMLMKSIDVRELPEDLSGVADKLGIKRDRAGFAMFNDKLSLTSVSVVPRLYCTDEEPSYKLASLFEHASINTVAMCLDQAAAFVIKYAQEQVRQTHTNEMHMLQNRAHTVWVPVRHNSERLTVLRLFFRLNGTFELFAYSPDDSSLWTGGINYMVAYHEFGS